MARTIRQIFVPPKGKLFNAFLKIAGDGRVIVVIPRSKSAGVYTSLPQIRPMNWRRWRTIAVEPAPISPLP